MTELSKRERVLAALQGETVDRVPLSFWGHNYAMENSAADLAQETLRVATTFDWDYVKVQSRFTCFAEAWGGEWRPSGRLTVQPTLVKPVVQSPADLDRIAPVDVTDGPLGEQLEALRLIRCGLPDDRPVIMTIFAPLMVLRFCFRGSTPEALAAARSEPTLVERALRAIADTLAAFGQASLAAGADGIFYATNVATQDLISVDEVHRFQRPFDLPILESVAGAPFNMLHVCGARTHFEAFADYPVACFNWALGDGNPDLVAGRARTGKAVVGGISAKPQLRTMTPEQVAGEARTALEQTEGHRFLMAPGCSIDPDTPAENLLAARAVVRGG